MQILTVWAALGGLAEGNGFLWWSLPIPPLSNCYKESKCFRENKQRGQGQEEREKEKERKRKRKRNAQKAEVYVGGKDEEMDDKGWIC